jgi:DNA gyrase/topoisomerase IV subunit B
LAEQVTFKELDDRSHCLAKPGMYIGSTTTEEHQGIINFKHQAIRYVPGLIKLFSEILDNSIDEHIRTKGEYSTKIDVSIGVDIDGSFVTVTDNGRGIPVQEHGDSWIPVKAWTRLRAGANFGDDTKRDTIGTNGIGSALVNIFSTMFIGTTCDGKRSMTVTSRSNMEHIEYALGKGTKNGTSVTFYPDLARFGVTEIDEHHIEIIKDRLTNLAIIYPAIKFSFNGETLKFKSLKEIAVNFSDNYVIDKSDNVSLVLAPSGLDEEFRCLSYINGIHAKNGGSHVEYAMNMLTQHIRTAIKKKYKFDVMPNQIRQHLLFASWITGATNLKFDSQTKERITNPQSEVSGLFSGIDFEKLAKKVLDTPDIIEPIVSALVRKQEAAEAAELRKKNKDIEKANLRHIVKFTDAAEKVDRANCHLMICEGDSAANSILSARTKYIGCYPLKGKPMNALAADKSEIMANKELTELMAIMGLQIGKPVVPSEMRFGKIVMVTDADQDGSSISGLLFAMFRKFWPELFEMGRIYYFKTPIMKAIQGKSEHYFDSLSDFESWQKKQTKPFKTRYLKGLGSSTAADFRMYFEEIETRLIQIKVESPIDFEIVDMLYSKGSGSADKRKTWLAIE